MTLAERILRKLVKDGAGTGYLKLDGDWLRVDAEAFLSDEEQAAVQVMIAEADGRAPVES